MSDFVRDGIAYPGSLGRDNSLIVTTQRERWAAKGYTFVGGQGAEGAGFVTITSMDETTAAVALQSPTGTNTVVVPLHLTLYIVNEDGGATNARFAVTKAADECATSLTVSGTALNSQCTYTKNSMNTRTATLVHTATVSALTTTDYIAFDWMYTADAPLSTVLPSFGGPGPVGRLDLYARGPFYMTQGAALLVYIVTASSASDASVSITWAEVPSNELIL